MKPCFLYDKCIFIKFLIFCFKKQNRGKSLETQIFFHTLLYFLHIFPDLENTLIKFHTFPNPIATLYQLYISTLSNKFFILPSIKICNQKYIFILNLQIKVINTLIALIYIYLCCQTINQIQNKSFCLHKICMCTVYIYYVYI